MKNHITKSGELGFEPKESGFRAPFSPVLPYLLQPTLWYKFCTSLCEILLIMLLSWESTLLPFYSTNSLCLSTPSSINTFSTKGFQQFQSLEFSYHRFENITLLVFCLLLSHSFSISLLDSSLSTLFFFSTYSLPLWEHLSPNDNIYLPMFWKSSFDCASQFHKSPPECAPTPRTPYCQHWYLLCYFCCLTAMPPLFTQSLKPGTQTWSPSLLSLSSPNPRTPPNSVCFTLYCVTIDFFPFMSSISSSPLYCSCDYFSRLWAGFPGAYSLQFYLHISISLWGVTDFQDDFHNPQRYSLHMRNFAAKSYILFFR